MSLRADRIKRARRRVDARRAALGNYADRRRDDIRDQARATYGRNLGRTKFGKTDTGSKRRGFWGDLKQMGSDLSNIGPMRDAKTMVKDVIVNPAKEGIERFIDYFPEGSEKWKIPSSLMLYDAIAQGREEDKAVRRDDKKFTIGGDPLAIDQGTSAHKFLSNLPGMDKRALNQAIRDDDLHWTDLKDASGDNYEASAGYLALLNDPSRLKKYTPITGLNYLRSITGDPSNLGWGAFEQMREGDFEGLNLPAGAEEGDYSGLTSTGIAKKLLPYYQAAADEMYGQGFIGDTAATNYGSPHMGPTVAPDYGDLRSTYTVPVTDEGMEQMELIENLSPAELYKMRSQMQERGGFTQPSAGAIAEYATDINNLTPGAAILGMQGLDPSIISNMNLSYFPPGFVEEDEEEDFIMGYDR
jgi:hypothetical protein